MNDSFSCNNASAVNGTDDREARPKFWIAAYTRPKGEKKAASEIASSLHIETYAPTQTAVRQWSDRKKRIEVVVIPMIIFIGASSEEEIAAIKKHPLILKIFSMPGQKTPALIPDQQIERLRYMLYESDRPVEFVQGDFKESDAVKIIHGPLCGLEGVVERSSDGRTYIIITIDMLGGAKTSVNPSDLKRIESK